MAIRGRVAAAVSALVLAGSAIGVIATAAPASAATGGNSALQYCESIAATYPGVITGACTSYFLSVDSIAATNEYDCTYFIVPAGAFATVGECVDALQKLLGP